MPSLGCALNPNIFLSRYWIILCVSETIYFCSVCNGHLKIKNVKKYLYIAQQFCKHKLISVSIKQNIQILKGCFITCKNGFQPIIMTSAKFFFLRNINVIGISRLSKGF